MSKRILVLFSLTVAALCGLSIRIISVNAGEYAKTASYSNSRTLAVAESRGTIYDCNLTPLVNAQDEYAVAMKPTTLALNSVTPYVGAERLAILRDELASGNPSLLRVPQKVEGGSDIKVIGYKKRYSDKQYATHLIGYIDADGVGVTGIEKSYNDYLTENSGKLRAAFYVDALGRNLSGAEIDILDDGYNIERGVVLTVDLKVQKAIEDALDKYGWESGCAVAMDPQTGAVRAMVSRPNYNPYNVAESLNAANSPLLNKALMAYSVGSTFKVVVAAAALEADFTSAEFTTSCAGVMKCGDTEFGCFEKTPHGAQTMREALIHSCNTYFIELAQDIGAERILSMAADMGFGKRFALSASVVSKSGALPDAAELDSQAAVANLGFGQGSLLATPLQLATAFSAVANGGSYVNPYLFGGYVNDNGEFSEDYNVRNSARRKTRIMKPATAQSLREMLTAVVESNERVKPAVVSAAGKTATAETGQYRNGEEICHTWFAGWYPAENPELVIVLMKESGSTGISDCGPVFKNIVDSLTSNTN